MGATESKFDSCGTCEMMVARDKATNQPMTSLTNGLFRHYKEGLLTDYELHCQGRVFKVHKLVICSQSKVLEKAINGPFKESHTGVFDMPDDDPIDVENLIHGMYKLSIPNGMDRTNGDRFYSCAAVTNARTYAIADKYDVPSVKAIARQQFECLYPEGCGIRWTGAKISSFAEAACIACTTTLSHDRSLRDVIMRVILNSGDALTMSKALSDALKGDVSELAVEVALKMLSKPTVDPNVRPRGGPDPVYARLAKFCPKCGSADQVHVKLRKIAPTGPYTGT